MQRDTFYHSMSRKREIGNNEDATRREVASHNSRNYVNLSSLSDENSLMRRSRISLILRMFLFIRT